MKKYSTDYFEKKYRILLDKLLQKKGFEEHIRAVRKELGMPEEGFKSAPDFGYFVLQKLSDDEVNSLIFFAFIDAYTHEKKISVSEENRGEIIDAFLKNQKEKNEGALPALFKILQAVETHHNLFSKSPIVEGNAYLSSLWPAVKKTMQKYWGVDLLDDHVIIHYIEKYLFMGRTGVDLYIKSKISCHNCKYLGVDHFSPHRHHMDGKDEGPYSKKYVFNKETVNMLSAYFNCVFLLIKPYATKEMVIQYIEDNWDDLKEHVVEKNTFYKQFDVNPSMIKESDTERSRLVYELHKLSKKELFKRYKLDEDLTHKGVYKEAIVSAILKQEHGIDMSSEAVKKSAARYAKSIEVQQKPKDIRDI